VRYNGVFQLFHLFCVISSGVLARQLLWLRIRGVQFSFFSNDVSLHDHKSVVRVAWGIFFIDNDKKI
jgi:hypothetical protein